MRRGVRGVKDRKKERKARWHAHLIGAEGEDAIQVFD